MRPGWTDEPLEKTVSNTAETLGIAGLVISLVSLPFILCCGIGAVVAVPLALVGGGCSVAALVQAPKSRNPSTARWTGGFGLGLAILSIIAAMAYAVLMFSIMTNVSSSTSVFLTSLPLTLTAAPTP
jgi:hypothetical protein